MRLAVAALLLAGCRSPAPAPEPAPSASAPSAPVEVHFSPHGGCTEAVVALIASARTSIRVQAYSFTSRPIARALEEAQGRGVAVEAVLDRSDRGGDRVHELEAAGVRVSFDAKHPIAHNKVLIVDERAVETGSFNFTHQAESNAENCLVIRDPAIARQYLEQWQIHRAHAEGAAPTP